jgi:hypothetical protein
MRCETLIGRRAQRRCGKHGAAYMIQAAERRAKTESGSQVRFKEVGGWFIAASAASAQQVLCDRHVALARRQGWVATPIRETTDIHERHFG